MHPYSQFFRFRDSFRLCLSICLNIRSFTLLLSWVILMGFFFLFFGVLGSIFFGGTHFGSGSSLFQRVLLLTLQPCCLCIFAKINNLPDIKWPLYAEEPYCYVIMGRAWAFSSGSLYRSGREAAPFERCTLLLAWPAVINVNEVYTTVTMVRMGQTGKVCLASGCISTIFRAPLR